MHRGFEDDGPRDPGDRLIDDSDPRQKKDRMLDKTIADTFPASDPPSSRPDPEEDSFAAMGPKPFVTNEFSEFRITLTVEG